MKSTPLTQGISLLIVLVYSIYAFMTMPVPGTLVSIALGLMAFAYLESTELAVAITVISGTLYHLVYRSGSTKRSEGFVDGAEKIVKRIETLKREPVHEGPRPVLSSSFAEGFQDASGNDTTTQTNTAATSAPAPANAPTGGAMSDTPPPAPPTAAATVQKKEGTAASTPAAPESATAGGPPATAAMEAAAGFQGSTGQEAEFKLGVIPDDKKGGYHIDQGTTIINALNSLKPDQVKAMTDDTRKLIETQKSLMGMLGTMKPMLQDGRQMMQNFQEMFGNGNGGGPMGAMKF
jgi:hypothetical protein